MFLLKISPVIYYLGTLPQINKTGNLLEKGKGIDFGKDIIKSHSNKKKKKEKKNDENNNISNISITSIKCQLELVKKEKHDIYLKQKCSKLNTKEKNNKVNSDKTAGNSKHAWLAQTCFENDYQETIK